MAAKKTKQWYMEEVARLNGQLKTLESITHQKLALPPASPEYISVLNREERLVYINDSAAAKLGLKPEDII